MVATTTSGAVDHDADVIVVGAGPAGSATAYHLARAGLDVLLLEKAAFPREKVCGDGLTPRAVRQLTRMGIDTSEPAGWRHTRGLRVIGGDVRLELPWPELASYPDHGLVRTRLDLDEILARQAAKAGAALRERTVVTGPVLDERTGRIGGVTARAVDEAGRRAGDDTVLRAPLVVAADGNSSRLALAMGLHKRADRPVGVAVRTYYASPRHDDDWLESWLELWDGPVGSGRLLPGYGWVFGMGDGTSNVGVGLLNTTAGHGGEDYRAMLRRWVGAMPPEWGFDADHQVGEVRGAALPMGFNRTPHYTRGLLLVGDAGGLVNPFSGEGIAYALESGVMAADVAQEALSRRSDRAAERALDGYPRALQQVYGGYFTLGRVFVRLIGDPRVMKVMTRHGLPRPALMRIAFKLLTNLTDPRGGDAADRIVNGLSRLAPAG